MDRFRNAGLFGRDFRLTNVILSSLTESLSCQDGRGSVLAHTTSLSRAVARLAVLVALAPGGLVHGQTAAEVAELRARAERGDLYAQFDLGVMYDTGRDVPQDDTKAVRWYRPAAAQGHANAMSDLGFMYGTGRGVPQDHIQAHMWRNLAASRLTGENRGVAVRGRDTLASLMTPDQLAEAQRRAREWDAAHPREP